jgi:hypothetical protein
MIRIAALRTVFRQQEAMIGPCFRLFRVAPPSPEADDYLGFEA